MAASQGATTRRSTKDADRVELVLSQIEQLPTLPVVATRVLQATTSADAGAAEVVALIEADQALTAKILRLSADLPIVIEIVDSEDKIDAFLPVLDGMMPGGLVTLEKVKILRYGQ